MEVVGEGSDGGCYTTKCEAAAPFYSERRKRPFATPVTENSLLFALWFGNGVVCNDKYPVLGVAVF